MTNRWVPLLLGGAMVMSTACAPMMRMSPDRDAVILLPENSKAATSEHFHRKESQLMWLFTGPSVMPTDYLAQVAPNKALRNVRVKQELDYFHSFVTLAVAIAAETATMLYAPGDFKSYGPLVYFALATLIPQKINTEIEGDVAEPPSDLGQGR